MRGKNTGKKAPLPSRDSVKLPPRPLLKKPLENDCFLIDRVKDAAEGSVPKRLGAEITYFRFPVEVDAQMEYLIRRCKLAWSF